MQRDKLKISVKEIIMDIGYKGYSTTQEFPINREFNKKFFEFYKNEERLAVMYKIAEASYVGRFDDVPDDLAHVERKVINSSMSASVLAKLDIKKLYNKPYEAWGVESYERQNYPVSKESVVTDMYMCVNPMRNNSKRRQKNVMGLYWNYADLDYTKTAEYGDMSPFEFFYGCLRPLFDEIIPEPTVVAFSGQGFHLYWKLYHNETYDPKYAYETLDSRKRWKRINRRLSEELKEFGADLKVSFDEARLLRMPGSFNSKNGKEVVIVHFNEDAKYTLFNIDSFFNTKEPSGKMFDLFDEMTKFIDYDESRSLTRTYVHSFITKNYKKYCRKKFGKSTDKQIAYCRRLAEKCGITAPKTIRYEYDAHLFIKKCKSILGIGYSSAEKLLQRRLNVIEAVIGDNNDRTGFRETTLFVARLAKLDLTGGDKDEAIRYIKQLNKSFSKPLPEKEVISATKSAEDYYFNKSKQMRMTNAKFFEYIGVAEEEIEKYWQNAKRTPEEEAAYKEMCRERNKRYLKTFRHKKRLAEGKHATWAEDKQEELEKVKDCIVNGMKMRRPLKVTRIMDTLNLTRSTVQRDLFKLFGTQSLKTVLDTVNGMITDELTVKECLDMMDLTMTDKMEENSDGPAINENNEKSTKNECDDSTKKSSHTKKDGLIIKSLFKGVSKVTSLPLREYIAIDLHSEEDNCDKYIRSEDCRSIFSNEDSCKDSVSEDNSKEDDCNKDMYTVNPFAKQARNRLVAKMIALHDKPVSENYLTRAVLSKTHPKNNTDNKEKSEKIRCNDNSIKRKSILDETVSAIKTLWGIA